MDVNHATRISAMVFVTTLVGTASAHHSHVAHYDPDRALEVTGVVTDFRMKNPHSLILLEATNADGTTQQWEVEAAPAIGLKRQGWTNNTLSPGDTVTITGWPHRRSNKPLLLAKTYLKSDGTVLPAGGPTTPRAYEANATSLGFSGLWQLKLDRDLEAPVDPGPLLPLSAAGLEARDNYDRNRSPITTCDEPINVPGLYYRPYYLKTQVSDEELVLHFELFDVIRTIPIGLEAELQEPSGLFGQARARKESHDLVIQSSDFPPSVWGLSDAELPLANGGDIPSSSKKRLTERYSLSEDGKTLRLDYVVEDPIYLTAPYADHLEFARLTENQEMYEYNCDADSAWLSTGLPRPDR